MSFEDKTLNCVDCGQEFVHSAQDQTFYAERGFANEPKRCKECRDKRKTRGARGGGRSGLGDRGPRESFDVVCAECGVSTTVPFKPSGDRPVYCRDCFRASRQRT